MGHLGKLAVSSLVFSARLRSERQGISSAFRRRRHSDKFGALMFYAVGIQGVPKIVLIGDDLSHALLTILGANSVGVLQISMG